MLRSCTSVNIEESVGAALSNHSLPESGLQPILAPPPTQVGPWLRLAALSTDVDPVSELEYTQMVSEY